MSMEEIIEELRAGNPSAERLKEIADLLELAKRPHRVKLSLLRAQQIRALYRMGYKKALLAKLFGVGVSCIKNVIYQVSWREPEPEPLEELRHQA